MLLIIPIRVGALKNDCLGGGDGFRFQPKIFGKFTVTGTFGVLPNLYLRVKTQFYAKITYTFDRAFGLTESNLKGVEKINNWGG